MRNEILSKNEKIELTLPVNSAYVSAARLTASSISNRIGFNIEDIEDIKSAVSEACIFLIRQCMNVGGQNFHIEFHLQEETLEIHLNAKVNNKTDDSSEYGLGILMIQAMMDDFKMDTKDGLILITMKKKKK